MRRREKAQSIIEYTLLLVILISALVLMGTYAKRAFCGRIKSSLDQISEKHYNPDTASSTITITSNSNSTTTLETSTQAPEGAGVDPEGLNFYTYSTEHSAENTSRFGQE